MNKLLAFLMLLSLSLGTNTFAQGDDQTNTPDSIVADSSTGQSSTTALGSAAATSISTSDPIEIKKSFTEMIKDKFIEGGWEFMSLVLICLIFGLAFAIERIIMLNLSSVNNEKFITDVDSALGSGGTEAAKELCRNTRGPVAHIFFEGLNRSKQGLDVVEKTVVSSGSVQMGLLEKGMVWISLFIALAPMLGFMGTVIGMIDAFDAIEAAGDIQPKLVAHGIKVALLTSLAGLIVAVILQVFYNYIVSKIDGLVNEMEDSSIKLVDMLIEHKALNK